MTKLSRQRVKRNFNTQVYTICVIFNTFAEKKKCFWKILVKSALKEAKHTRVALCSTPDECLAHTQAAPAGGAPPHQILNTYLHSLSSRSK